MKLRRDHETGWECFKRWGGYLVGILFVLLILLVFYIQLRKDSCHDVCKGEGYPTGHARFNNCRCITYTPYKGEW